MVYSCGNFVFLWGTLSQAVFFSLDYVATIVVECRYRTICESNRTIRFDSGQNQGESQIAFDCVRIAESRREYMNRMKTWVSRWGGSYFRTKTQKWLAGKASKPLLESMELKTRLRSRFFHIWFETRRHQLAIESSISWVKAPRHHHHSRIDQRSTHFIV